MSAAPDLVCVGRIVREMIQFPDQVKGPLLGSPPAYCAVAAARQGTRTGIVSKIGPQTTLELLSPLRQAGIDTSGIAAGERDTLSELIYAVDGSKEIRYPQMSDPITAEDIPQHYRGCGIVYVCTMDNDVPLEHLAGVVGQGETSAVDLGGYGGVHMSVRSRRAVASLQELASDVAAHFHIVKASDEDAASIFGEHDPPAAARRLQQCGPAVVVITLGEEGVLVRTGRQEYHVPPVPGQVIDTTGGGDTFMAGFLSAYLRSQDPLLAARWGCATAICVIEKSGGVRLERMPTRRQVENRVEVSYR